MEEFGYAPTGESYGFEPITFSLGSLTSEDLSIKWLCHSDGVNFSERFSRRYPSLVVTGIGLSGPPHVGTLSQILRAITLQRAGVPVQFVLGDLDAYNGKKVPLSTVRELAERYRRFVTKLGFNTEPPNILRSQEEKDALPVLRTAYLLFSYFGDEKLAATEEDLHDFYVKEGKVDSQMTLPRKASLVLMLADFVHPAISSERNNIMVTLGIDEHKYVVPLMQALDSLKRDGLVSENTLIARLYSPIIKGLFGYPKMSKSFPKSGIFAGIGRDTIEDLLLNGDQNNDENNYDPYSNPVFQIALAVMLLHPPEVEELGRWCQENGNAWRNFKLDLASYLYSLFNLWE